MSTEDKKIDLDALAESNFGPLFAVEIGARNQHRPERPTHKGALFHIYPDDGCTFARSPIAVIDRAEDCDEEFRSGAEAAANLFAAAPALLALAKAQRKSMEDLEADNALLRTVMQADASLISTLYADLEGLKEDKERLDHLQSWLDRKEYTGRCIVRPSTTHRGWRFSETSWPGAVESVREAIDASRLLGEKGETLCTECGGRGEMFFCSGVCRNYREDAEDGSPFTRQKVKCPTCNGEGGEPWQS